MLALGVGLAIVPRVGGGEAEKMWFCRAFLLIQPPHLAASQSGDAAFRSGFYKEACHTDGCLRLLCPSSGLVSLGGKPKPSCGACPKFEASQIDS